MRTRGPDRCAREVEPGAQTNQGAVVEAALQIIAGCINIRTEGA